MKDWLGTAPAGQKGQTRGPTSTREHPPRNTRRGNYHTMYWLFHIWHHMTSPTTPTWWRAKTFSPWRRTDTHLWSSGDIEVLAEVKICMSPTNGHQDWHPLSFRKHYRSIRSLQVRVWGRTQVGTVNNRRTRMITDGMTIRTRTYNWFTSPTCTSGGRHRTTG
jgi:hypothetical protein